MGLPLVALLLAAPRAASADEAAIRAVYRAFEEGFERQDVDALEPLFAQDYAATLPDGSTSGRDETLSDIGEEARSAIAPVHCKEQLKRLAIDGDGATVEVAEETAYQVRSPDGKLHSYRYTESYEDRLAKVDGRWLLRSTRYGPGGDEQLDGKPIARGQLKKALEAVGPAAPAVPATSGAE